MSNDKQVKIVFAGDHASPELKSYLKESVPADYEIIDLGTNDDESVDYPDYAQKLAEFMQQNPDYLGVLICGSGIGISIAANRHKHLRAALCHNKLTAELARQHNDANVLVLGARVLTREEAQEILQIFLATDFAGGRHARRVKKLDM